MTRPRCCCKIEFCPPRKYFVPADRPVKGAHTVRLLPEEAEALRLKNVKGLDQTAGARRMGISQSTFQRIVSSAYRKVSMALVYGRPIEIANLKNKK